MTAGRPRKGLEEGKEECARDRLAALEEWKCDDRPYVQETGAQNNGRRTTASRKRREAAQVARRKAGTWLKRQPSVGRCSGGAGRSSDGRSNRGVGEGLAVQAMCLGGRSRERERVGGLLRWEGVEWSGRRTEERWLPRVLGRARLACDGTEARTVSSDGEARAARCRAAELRAGRIFFSSFGGFWLLAPGFWLPCLRLCCVGLGEQGLWEALLWSRGGRDRLMCWRC